MLDAGDPPLLEVEIARKTHKRTKETLEVIRDLRFTLRKGSVTCLLGPSGCGKTTALRIVMGLDDAYEGRVVAPTGMLRLGVVFQDARLLPWRTVEENVRLVAPSLETAAMNDLLCELGLEPWRTHRPNQISGGMARRVALARALSVAPDLLILDEAFVSLDESNADILRAVVFGAVARRRATVLMVTHNVREAIEFSDTVLLLAPRPTHVLETISFDRPSRERSAAWIDLERARILAKAGVAFDGSGR